MVIDIPPQLQERVVCSIAAAVRYGIPANIMLAVAEKEGGKAGQWVPNTNGTHDVGTLQFNTAYLRQLSAYGITPGDVAAAGCYPYELAAWRLHRHIKSDGGDLWTRCANYHSRTPIFNARYRQDLVRISLRWAEWLAVRYSIHEFSKANMMTNSKQFLPAVVGRTIARTSKHRSLTVSESGYVPRSVRASKGAEP